MAFVHDRAAQTGTSGDRRFNRTPGAVKAVRLLDADRDLARGLGANAAEARAAAILHSAGIRGFVQNAEIRLPDGSTRMIDFYWPGLRACLEIASVEFHFDRALGRYRSAEESAPNLPGRPLAEHYLGLLDRARGGP